MAKVIVYIVKLLKNGKIVRLEKKINYKKYAPYIDLNKLIKNITNNIYYFIE